MSNETQGASPNMMDQSFFMLSQAIAHLGVMREHVRQMGASDGDDDRAAMYRRAAVAQATQGANVCAQVHGALTAFVEQMGDKARIVTPR